MKNFSVIVACDEAQGIGKGGVLPWHLSADLKHFKEITTQEHGSGQNVVIMGRKTWESIPERFRPLPARINVVITRQPGYSLPHGVVRVASLQEAFKVFCDVARKDVDGVFVIGGAQVFAEAIEHPLCSKVYLTRIEHRFDCDVFFPDIPQRFVESSRSRKYQENEKMFSFLTLSA